MRDGDRTLESNLRWASDNPPLAIKVAAGFLDPSGDALQIDGSKPGFIVLRIREKDE